MFIFEGEGGLTPGATHETANSALGLALDNLYYMVDWNDFGIDDHPVSSAVYGTPYDWFASHGWRVFGAEQGSEWACLTKAFLSMQIESNPDRVPSVMWFKTRKGRDYLKYDNDSHGAPHALDCELFWQTKKPFAEKYGVTFTNCDNAAPKDPAALQAEFEANLKAVIEVLHRDQALIDYLADRLVALGDSVPNEIPGYRLGKKGNPYQDPACTITRIIRRIYTPSRAHRWPTARRWPSGARWVNAFRQAIIRSSVVHRFARLTWPVRRRSTASPPNMVISPAMAGTSGSAIPRDIVAARNHRIRQRRHFGGDGLSESFHRPRKRVRRLRGACSTYGSFSYLKYGLMRLYVSSRKIASGRR